MLMLFYYLYFICLSTCKGKLRLQQKVLNVEEYKTCSASCSLRNSLGWSLYLVNFDRAVELSPLLLEYQLGLVFIPGKLRQSC